MSCSKDCIEGMHGVINDPYNYYCFTGLCFLTGPHIVDSTLVVILKLLHQNFITQ